MKRHRFDVLAGIQRPAILVEGGFVSNPVEGARIHKPEYRDALADAIAGGIQNFRKALLAGSKVPMRSSTPAPKKKEAG